MSLCGFGQVGDLIGKSLCLKGKTIIDSKYNIKGIKNAKFQTLIVGGTTVSGNTMNIINANITGELTSNMINVFGPTILDGDLCVTGFTKIEDIYSGGNSIVESDLCVNGVTKLGGNVTVIGDLEVNGTITSMGGSIGGLAELSNVFNLTSPNANAWIGIPSELMPASIMLVCNGCTGNVISIDSMTGNLLYQPSPDQTTSRIDLFQYSGLDSNNVRHKISQFICQPATTPPFMNNLKTTEQVLSSLPYEKTPFSLVGQGVVSGTNDPDWSTFNYIDIETYTAPRGTFETLYGMGTLADILPELPYGSNESGNLLAAGVQNGTGNSSVTLEGFGPGFDGYSFTIDAPVDSNGVVTYKYYGDPASGWQDDPAIKWDTAVRYKVQINDTVGIPSNIGYYYFGVVNAPTINLSYNLIPAGGYQDIGCNWHILRYSGLTANSRWIVPQTGMYTLSATMTGGNTFELTLVRAVGASPNGCADGPGVLIQKFQSGAGTQSYTYTGLFNAGEVIYNRNNFVFSTQSGNFQIESLF